MSKIKQVIVIRKDLKMRRGKEIAQGSHASGSWMAQELLSAFEEQRPPRLTPEQLQWIKDKFTKICLQVENEKELHDIFRDSKNLGLLVNLITDAGLTEFNNVPTKTCLSIGPNVDSEINKITSNLKLY